jgi:hypothetical protein
VVWEIDDDEYAPAIAKAIYGVRTRGKGESTSRSRGRSI